MIAIFLALGILPAALGLSLVQAQAQAQTPLPEPARGASLYLALPGGEASCVECHGPDPGQDRNRLLNAAQGPEAISEAIRKAAAMGYLTGLLSTADRADLSAFIALVSAESLGSTAAAVWPWGVEFGRVAPGAAAPAQAVRLHNRGTAELTLAPQLRNLAGDGATGLSLTHDCPTTLPPGADCTAHVGLVAGAEGRVQAALVWGDTGPAAPRPVGLAVTVSAAAAGAGQWLGEATQRAQALEAAPAQTTAVMLTMHNAGRAPLALGVPAITGPGRAAFRLEAGGCAANLVLPVDGRCTVRLVATAPSAGREEALLQWRNDGSHAPVQRLSVRAVGAALPVPADPTASPPISPPVSPPVSPTGTGTVQSPTVQPAPIPNPSAQAEPSAAGGCSRVAWQPGRADPLLPGLVALAVLMLAWRTRGGRNAGGGRSLAPS